MLPCHASFCGQVSPPEVSGTCRTGSEGRNGPPASRDRVAATARGYAIYRGITTGLNEAFVVDNKTKEALVAEDPKSAEILKPVLRGRDIQRYQAQWQGLWLIATFPALDLSIDRYPAVKRHLLSFGKQRLEQSGKRLADGTTRARKKTGHAWFEMQDTCAYHAEFAKEKLFWMDMSPEGRFAYDDREILCNDKGFILLGQHLKYLCAILNSSLVTWLVRTSALTTGMGVLQWKKFTVERLPVPRIGGGEQRPFVELVDHIIEAKKAHAASDAEELERVIDRLVYDLYGLTSREISAVEAVLS